jgi:hypothetical protein
VGEDGHEVDDVEVGHERVRQLDEHAAEALLIGHHRPPRLPAMYGAASP